MHYLDSGKERERGLSEGPPLRRGEGGSLACIPDGGTYSRKPPRFFIHIHRAGELHLGTMMNPLPLRNPRGRVPVFPVRYGTLSDDDKSESSANGGRNSRARGPETNEERPLTPSAPAVENGSKPIYKSEEC